MIDDRELALIAVFRLHEVASRLSVLSRVTKSQQLARVLQDVSEQLTQHETKVSAAAQTVASPGSRVKGQGSDAEVSDGRPLPLVAERP